MSTQKIARITWAEIESKLGLKFSTKPDLLPSATAAPPKTQLLSLNELLRKRCTDGERTHHLLKLIGFLLASRYSAGEAMSTLLHWNSLNSPPLDEEKIRSTFQSVLKSDQRNHPERYLQSTEQPKLFSVEQGRIDRFLKSDPAPRRWLVNDLIVLGKVGAIIAPGASSKSQLLLQLAVGVAAGGTVADCWQVTETGSVLVFFAEDDEDEIHRRISRVAKRLQLAGMANAIETLKKNLYVYSTVGKDTLLTKRTTTGEVSATHVVDQIIALSSQINNLKLIVIDPAPDGHPKLPHLWPVKLLQAGRSDGDYKGVTAMREAASFKR